MRVAAGDIGTNSGCALIPGRNFRGMIDEASIYDYEMTAEEAQAAIRSAPPTARKRVGARR